MDKLYSIKQSSEITGISIPMLKKLIFNKQITVVKIGWKNFIKESTLQEYIDKNTVVGE